MKETWKDIPGYEGRYQVSDSGNVRSLPGGRRNGEVLKPGKSSNGYLTVALYKDKRARSYLIQDLVLSAFVGPKPKGHFTRHKDDCRTNNTLWNLEYGTPTENYKDVYALGRTHKKLTSEDVKAIRNRLMCGENKHRLAQEYNVCERVIRNIREGRTFTWVK